MFETLRLWKNTFALVVVSYIFHITTWQLCLQLVEWSECGDEIKTLKQVWLKHSQHMDIVTHYLNSKKYFMVRSLIKQMFKNFKFNLWFLINKK